MVEDPIYRMLVNKHGSMRTDEAANIVTIEQQQTHHKWAKHAMTKLKSKMQSEGESVGSMLNNVMMGMLKQEMDVAEAYSPPRVAAMAQKMGLRASWSLDLTTFDERGIAWDFNKLEMRNKAARQLIQDNPRLLIGRPSCTPFSQMNNLNYVRKSAEEVKQRMDYGRRHLEFCARLCEIQWREGRYFLHEHPQGASSWQEECIKKLMGKNGVQRVVGDQCMYGLKLLKTN